MLVIGLTGGMGSGKSMALRVFKRLGAHIIDADRLAREAVRPGAPAHLAIRRTYGREVFHPNGRLNRKELARKVFGDRKAVEKLNSIIHPEVFRMEKRIIEETGKREKNAVVVVDAPLMIESGSHKWKDVLVVMKTSREKQIKRLLRTGKFTKGEIERRLDAQMPLEKKLSLADYVIENDGTLAEGRKNAEAAYMRILEENGMAGRRKRVMKK